MNRPVDAVTFDYWNTLVRPVPGAGSHRAARWMSILEEAGAAPERLVVDALFQAEWEAHDAAWRRGEQYTGERAARNAAANLGVPLDAAVLAELIEAFGSVDDLEYSLCPGVGEALEDLRSRGVRVGIICDVGFTPSPVLRRLLADFGVLAHFEGWSFSDEVGWYKPAPEIFRHALGYLAAPAGRCVHVGDLRRTDVAGAKAAGMGAIRYHGVHDDPDGGPPADHDLADFADLLAVLGW